MFDSVNLLYFIYLYFKTVVLLVHDAGTVFDIWKAVTFLQKLCSFGLPTIGSDQKISVRNVFVMDLG